MVNQGESSHSPFVIGVAGGTASGKSSVCSRIVSRLALNGNNKRVAIISQDSFYKDLITVEDLAKATSGDYNFDHPDAIDYPLMGAALAELKAGKPVDIPKYDFRTNSRLVDDHAHVDPVDVILVEGILVFFDPKMRDTFDLKLFVDADPDIRLARRVERDTKERGRPLATVLHQYLTHVKPAFEEFCLPTKKYADVIIPRGAENEVAIDLIVQHIQDILRTVSLASLSPNLSRQLKPIKIELPPAAAMMGGGGGVMSSPQNERSENDVPNAVGTPTSPNTRKITRPH